MNAIVCSGLWLLLNSIAVMNWTAHTFARRVPVRKDGMSISVIIFIRAYSFKTLWLVPGCSSGGTTVGIDLCLNILGRVRSNVSYWIDYENLVCSVSLITCQACQPVLKGRYIWNSNISLVQSFGFFLTGNISHF